MDKKPNENSLGLRHKSHRWVTLLWLLVTFASVETVESQCLCFQNSCSFASYCQSFYIFSLFSSGECRQPTGPRCVECLSGLCEQIVGFCPWFFPVNQQRFVAFKHSQTWQAHIPWDCTEPRAQSLSSLIRRFDTLDSQAVNLNRFLIIYWALPYQLKPYCNWDLHKIQDSAKTMMNKLHWHEEPMPLNCLHFSWLRLSLFGCFCCCATPASQIWLLDVLFTRCIAWYWMWQRHKLFNACCILSHFPSLYAQPTWPVATPSHYSWSLTVQPEERKREPTSGAMKSWWRPSSKSIESWGNSKSCNPVFSAADKTIGMFFPKQCVHTEGFLR